MMQKDMSEIANKVRFSKGVIELVKATTSPVGTMQLEDCVDLEDLDFVLGEASLKLREVIEELDPEPKEESQAEERPQDAL